MTTFKIIKNNNAKCMDPILIEEGIYKSTPDLIRRIKTAKVLVIKKNSVKGKAPKPLIGKR